MQIDSHPTLTMLTAVLNRRDLIRRMIASVAAQTLDDYELVIVDNGSTDGTWEYCRELKDERIRVYQELRPGANYARNLGIARARGIWTMILDSDNELAEPNVLRNVMAALTRFSEADCVMTLTLGDGGRSMSHAPKRDEYLSFSEYASTRGELVPTVRTEWFKSHPYPEVSDLRTELPCCVYGQAAIENGLVIADIVSQRYHTDATNRICGAELSRSRCHELMIYYGLLLDRFRDELVRARRVRFEWLL